MNSRWWQRAWATFLRWISRRPAPLKTLKVEELPDQLNATSLYLVGEGKYLWFAAMVCPCGCDAIINLNLLPETRPRWKLTEHTDGTVSLHPSIWRTKDCRSHYFVRRGLIEWYHDD